jgi:hypothetical protein
VARRWERERGGRDAGAAGLARRSPGWPGPAPPAALATPPTTGPHWTGEWPRGGTCSVCITRPDLWLLLGQELGEEAEWAEERLRDVLRAPALAAVSTGRHMMLLAGASVVIVWCVRRRLVCCWGWQAETVVVAVSCLMPLAGRRRLAQVREWKGPAHPASSRPGSSS